MSSTEEEQARYLEDALKEVQKQAFFMKRAMDGDSLKLTLDHATEMLRELRTGLLSPKNYYELFMKIQDEMRELEEYLHSLHRSGRSIVEIYEQVQACANVVPRLYLLCCVGGVYITSKEAPAKDILKDLIEMIKGVQHPMRGLFLRSYLTTISKNRLPDTNSPYEGIGGHLPDALSFLLQNFVETNRLWVRLQTQGASKDKKKREKERMDLRVLVGTNLVRISQLEGLDVRVYGEEVLPKILEEVVACKDTIAQSYLMDCIIQVFPDEFHLQTLELFLKTIVSLKEKVAVRSILEGMMDRLANHFAQSNSSNAANGGAPARLPTDVPAFKLFNDCVTTLIEDRANMSLPETLRLQRALLKFALSCYPHRLDYVAHCLGTAGALIAKTDYAQQEKKGGENERVEDETTQQIEQLLSAPLASLALQVLDIPSYSKLMSYLPWANWREVAVSLLESVVDASSAFRDTNALEQLFQMITPLLKDSASAPVRATEEDEEASAAQKRATLSPVFLKEQHLVARIPLLAKHEDSDVVLRLLLITRTNLTVGGPQRMQFTFPSLIFAALSLLRVVLAREKDVAEGVANATAPQLSSKKVLQFVMESIATLAASQPETAMRLYLQAAQAADTARLHAITYEFVKEALLLYELEITDSRQQVVALTSCVGALLNCRQLACVNDDYDSLVTKIAQYSNKLLKKADQSKMISLCSLLFFPTNRSEELAEAKPYADADRVLECIQRALKIASLANPNLYVDILERALFFFENDNPAVSARFIQGLVSLINETIATDASALLPATQLHYKNTLAYIRSRKNSSETADKFEELDV